MISTMAEKHTNNQLIIFGVVFIFVGLMAPWLIKAKYLGILPLANVSIDTNSIESLLAASALLVLLNTIRALPIYIGVLLLVEGFGILKATQLWLCRLAIILLVPFIYQAVYLLHGVGYDFGIPALTMTLVIMVVSRMQNMARKIYHKLTVVALLLFGVEWLDIVPILTPYGFGRGVLSAHIKQIADLNNAVTILNVGGIAVFVIIVFNAFILARLLSLYTIEIKAVEQALEVEHLNNKMNLQAIENRSLREMQSLVHDLKTPLTSIQGLAGVMSMSKDPDIVEHYSNYISDMVDKMSIMIDELLKDDSRQVIPITELVNYAIAHVPQLYRNVKFESRIEVNTLVKVNKIKVARALINILENSLAAVEQEKGAITLTVEGKDDMIVLMIVDNGPGFIEGLKEKIWEVGFSNKNSSGLGLSYARDIVQKHGGTISIGNNENGGAKVLILLPEVCSNV